MKKVDKKIEYEFNSRTCVLQFINSQARKVNKKSSEILQKNVHRYTAKQSRLVK